MAETDVYFNCHSNDVLLMLTARWNNYSRRSMTEKCNHKESHRGVKPCQRIGRRRQQDQGAKKKKEEEERRRMYQCLRAVGGITGGALEGWTTDLLACART